MYKQFQTFVFQVFNQIVPPAENSFYFEGLKRPNVEIFLHKSKANRMNFDILKESQNNL